MKTDNKEKEEKKVENSVSGHLARRLNYAPVRVLSIVSGFALIRGLLALMGRFLLAFRRKATVSVDKGSLVLDVEWSIMGKSFRSTRTAAKISDLQAVRFENRKRYVHLLVGFGFLSIGVWLGVQWLIDGLRAGFPMLATVGACVVAGGVLVDLALYFLVPEGKGRNRMSLAMGPWTIRMAGIDPKEGELFIESVRESWREIPRAK